MPSGFQGPGYFDAQGNWVNGIPDETTINRTINTPNSSSGQPAYQDPSASSAEFATPQGGQMTPNSRTGEPAPGVRNLPAPRSSIPSVSPTLNPMTMPTGGAVGTAVGALANAPATDQGVYDQANSFNDWFNSTRIGKALNLATGHAEPRWGAVTQSGPGRSPSGPGTPPPPTPPDINLPQFDVPRPPMRPFVRGPVPYPMPQTQHGAPNLGYGVPGAQRQQQQQQQQAPSPMFTTIDRPNADVAGGRSVGGQLAPQYFNQAREPGGPAQMGALDLSGLFSHPAVAAAAAAHPAVRGAMAAPNMDDAALGQQILDGGGGRSGRARAQAAPRRFDAGKFFSNPANYQYPNMPY